MMRNVSKAKRLPSLGAIILGINCLPTSPARRFVPALTFGVSALTIA